MTDDPELIVIGSRAQAEAMGFRGGCLPDRPDIRVWYPGLPQTTESRPLRRVTIHNSALPHISEEFKQTLRKRQHPWGDLALWLEFPA